MLTINDLHYFVVNSYIITFIIDHYKKRMAGKLFPPLFTSEDDCWLKLNVNIDRKMVRRFRHISVMELPHRACRDLLHWSGSLVVEYVVDARAWVSGGECVFGN